MAAPANPDADVNLLETVQILHDHLTEALCQEVFEDLRDTERKRLWTLDKLVHFWTAVVLRAPPSLRHALAEAQGVGAPYPVVEASPQAFFARCQDLRPDFFQGVFEAFRQRVVDNEPRGFAAAWRPVGRRFAGIWIVDGSKLDAVARRLKVLWNDRSVPLPGSLLAFYDLERGILGKLVYDREAHRSELKAAVAALAEVPRDTLVVADRLYGVPQFFAALSTHGLFGVARRNQVATLVEKRRLSRRRHRGGWLEDWEVTLGVQAALPLRLVRWTKGKEVRELLTNVLDPKRLTAKEILGLYPERWKVERFFFDVKEVLNLHCFYGANTNAVAMQVYAVAIVHTAMRSAQARIARDAKIEPEDLSPQKLFPKIAAASWCLTTAEVTFEATRQANPRTRLAKPDWNEMSFATVPLRAVLKETRNDKRRKRRYCASRRKCRSLPKAKR